MNKGVNILCVFKKVKKSDGSECFKGILNTAILRKTKKEEVEITLISSESCSESFLDSFGKSGDRPDLIMIGDTGEEKRRTRGQEA